MKKTEQIARAAGQDAGNRNMKAAGRDKWNEHDWNAACAEFNRLWLDQTVIGEWIEKDKHLSKVQRGLKIHRRIEKARSKL